MRRVEGALEWLDRPVPPAERAAALADIHRLNTWFGGYWLSLRAIRRLLTIESSHRSLAVLDVGGGRGDFATRLVRWGRRRGFCLRVIVADRATEACAPGAGIVRVRADATALPFRQDAVEIATTALTLHHLEPDAAARCLAEMRGAARRAVVVNDLLRTPLTLALVWLATRLFCRHRYARHDGPLSVRRAYLADELRTLAGKAQIARVTVRQYPLLGRLLAVFE